MATLVGTSRSSLSPSVTTGVVRAWLSLASVGLLAIGASGVLAAVMGTAFGASFVSGDLPGVTYTADRCAELMEYAPGAGSCTAAAAVHHLDETVTYRIAAGVLGMVAFAAWYAWRRRDSLAGDPLPAAFTASAGAATFGVVGLGLLVAGVDGLVLGAGAGAYLSAALVSLAVAVGYLAGIVRALAVRPVATG
jgi:hypothetical protein